MNNLQNKVGLVTGAGHPKGIGWATALALASAGADVAVTDITSNEAGLQSLADEIRAMGRRSIAKILDVTDASQAKNVMDEVATELGQLDILVNNAGIGIGSPEFLENDDSVWNATFAVNLHGPINCCRAALPHMCALGSGSIVNVASLAGLRQLPSMPPPYTASKFAVIGLTKAIAHEFGAKGIRCNAVCPGSVATQMQDKAMEMMGANDDASRAAAEAEESAMIALGRAAAPSEVAAAVVYLSSPAAAYLTGVALPVDGGWSVGL